MATKAPRTTALDGAAGARLVPPADASHAPSESDPESDTDVEAHEHEHGAQVDRWDIARVAFVFACAAAVWFRVWEPFPRFSIIGVAGTVGGGWPIFHEAWENLRERRMTMELSMTIALVAALVIAEFFTALVITAFVLVAELLEGLTVGRGRTAIAQLLDLLPRSAIVRREGEPREMAVAELRVGDLVLVNPGSRIPVDGRVVAGHSFVDESSITGESQAAEKTAGASAYAGTINQSGALEIETARIGRDTSFGKIIEAVERAERSRAPIQRTADRLAGYLVYFALACAALTFLVTRDARSTISVIIVAGACGVAAGTPLAILGGIGRAARGGAIIKGGRHLEKLWDVDTVVFDKTGTLTYGQPQVRALYAAGGVSERELLWAAAVAERRSEHPLARAILAEADTRGIPRDEPETFSYEIGRGVVAQLDEVTIIVGVAALLADHGVDTAAVSPSDGAARIFVARGVHFLGAIDVSDQVRPEARTAVERLRALGVRTLLLTGDRRPVAAAVAQDIGVDEFAAELLPDAKLEFVRSLSQEGRTVAMLGDGVNDAPALMQASVGVAMGSGTDVARESANIVLLGSDLLTFVDTFELARRTRRTILQNFGGTLLVDGFGVGLAAFGLLNPLIAAFIHVTSELVFILNSARLLPAVPRESASA
jgi:Cu+-exporting ATPase